MPPVLPPTDVRPTLLIVDDSPENLTVLGELLQDSYTVRAANSGARALELAALQPQPDLILLDIMMPDLDGFQVLARLRANALTQDLPVIFVTAMSADADEEHGLALGAADYITKPIRPAVVLARVRNQLELRQARQQLKHQNDFLEQEINRRMHDNQLVQDVSIRALAHLAETRDLETGKHLRRVQEYIRLLAEQLRSHPRFAAHYTELLNVRSINLIAQSAPLHDIGKVGIPDDVLLKPGQLSAAQWEVMKTHAQLGAEAIALAQAEATQDGSKPVEFLSVAKQIAHWHHERWDGTGYPDGLRGDAIPLPARLMAIADVFDALISRRVYKEPIGFAMARDIISASAGSHFDPEITAVFLENYDALCAIATRHADSAEDIAGKLETRQHGVDPEASPEANPEANPKAQP